MTRRAAIAVIVGALSTPAHADTSYRWQLMVSDGVSNGLILISASDRLTSSTHGVFAYLGVASYALGAPILHAAHDDWGTAGLSLGTRVALPALLGWGAHGACMHWGGRDHRRRVDRAVPRLDRARSHRRAQDDHVPARRRLLTGLAG